MASTHDGGPFRVFSELPVGTWFTHRPRTPDSWLWFKVSDVTAFSYAIRNVAPVLFDQPVEECPDVVVKYPERLKDLKQ